MASSEATAGQPLCSDALPHTQTGRDSEADALTGAALDDGDGYRDDATVSTQASPGMGGHGV